KFVSSETTLMPSPTPASASSKTLDTRDVNCGAELALFSAPDFPPGAAVPFTGGAALPGADASVAGFASGVGGWGLVADFFFAGKFTLHNSGSSRHRQAAGIPRNHNIV